MMAAAITLKLKGEPATRMYSLAAGVSPGASVAGKRNSVFHCQGFARTTRNPLNKQGNTRRKSDAGACLKRFANGNGGRGRLPPPNAVLDFLSDCTPGCI